MDGTLKNCIFWKYIHLYSIGYYYAWITLETSINYFLIYQKDTDDFWLTLLAGSTKSGRNHAKSMTAINTGKSFFIPNSLAIALVARTTSPLLDFIVSTSQVDIFKKGGKNYIFCGLSLWQYQLWSFTFGHLPEILWFWNMASLQNLDQFL